MLSEKWLSPQELNKLAKEEGLAYNKGKFSPAERQQVVAAIESYQSVGRHPQLLSLVAAVSKQHMAAKHSHPPAIGAYYLQTTESAG
jgi:hypothetical protein